MINFLMELTILRPIFYAFVDLMRKQPSYADLKIFHFQGLIQIYWPMQRL